MTSSTKTRLTLLFIVVLVVSLGLKLANLFAGAPFITIDDQTMYEGGFLVWFGEVPPQRMHLESWVSGIISIATYVYGLMGSGNLGALGSNLVADAYRAFYLNPDPYVRSYRIFALVADMLVVLMVFLFAREVSKNVRGGHWFAFVVASFYLLSFNTLWSDVVARPDTLTALFGALGLFLYYKSEFGQRYKIFYASAVAFGMATGMKLHGAFFVVFVVLDLLRLWGIREGIRKVFPYGVIAVAVFLIAAGSPLFDPLLYVKLRYLNHKDDASPWIKWGEQFVVALYGMGWLGLPLLLFGAWSAIRNGDWKNRTISSVLFMALCWVALFCSIRQLRSYWMLPALPLFYLGAVYGLAQIRRLPVRMAIAAAMLGIMTFQCVQQMQAIHSTNYTQLRDWIKTNVSPSEPFYVLGYADFGVPRNTVAIQKQRAGTQRKLETIIADGEAFTARHVRMWEEKSRLTLYDMLQFRSDEGFEFYFYYETPLNDYKGIVEAAEMRYFIMQEHFPLESEPELQRMIEQEFESVATLTGPGGHSNGLQYQIFKRK